ncbi:hypothetical protein O181_018742 [Austropuccinia psidii MF-1]|uniref:Uncharacterized protein n=1 Tax=Austropuccinia psidii MF-1 TaxID=1389203 RepID=A0A9Q3CA60_9BASI|nr:hypothetical protein [Austropuccinia psidii MF-1]
MAPMARGPRSVGHLDPFWPNPMRPKGAKAGSQVGPKPHSDPPEPKLAINPLDPKLAKRPSGHQFGHKSCRTHFWPWITMDQHLSHCLWQSPEATRSAQSAFSSTYGEFFRFLHAIRNQGCRRGAYMVLYTIMHYFCSVIQW